MYQLNLKPDQLATLLLVLGSEKTRLYNQGHFSTAHDISDLLSLAKNAKKISQAS
jgi:hypothetical protein